MKIKVFDQTIIIEKKQVFFTVCTILGVIFLFYKMYSSDSIFEQVGTAPEIESVSSSAIPTGTPLSIVSETHDESVQVYLCGYVNKSGAYEISKGTTIYDIVKRAGGLKKNAAKSINLAYKIKDNCMIRIPSAKEKYSAEDIIVKGIVRTDRKTKKSKKGVPCKVKARDTDKININTASFEELQEIPWVGESTANSIIEYRKTDRFTSIEDIKKVSGIGESKFEKMKSRICV